MLFFTPAPPPVSYSHQVAPLLALQCYSCHGDSGGLSMRSYAELMLGGNLGKVVQPGKPDASLLVHFIEGRRGPAHRMPLDGRPLAPEQIQMLRQWIAEGAKQDAKPVPRRVLTLPGVRFGTANALRILCKVKTAAFLVLTVSDPRSRRVLFSDAASIKSPKQRGDAGQPGDLLTWEVRAGAGWPRAVLVTLAIEQAAGDLKATEFSAQPVNRQH